MNAHEVMMHVKERNRVLMILDLFRECVGQPREAPHVHSHVEILSLDVAGRDMLRIGIANDRFLFDAQTLRGAVRPRSGNSSAYA